MDSRLTFASRMNPDKLFDYLDGKLSPADRAQLEERLMSDSHLREQFNVAREIHRGGRDSREAIVPSDDLATVEKAGRLGRRIATAAIALVALNVAVGILVIAGKNKKPAGLTAQEAAIRQQLAASLGAAGARVLPPPSFVENEIGLPAPRAEWENLAEKVIAAAEKFGGSGAKDLPAETSLKVMIDIPSARVPEFRQSLPGAAASPGETPAAQPPPNERTILQVLISESGR